jgi:isopenicillin N synthase-like dioxygenase
VNDVPTIDIGKVDKHALQLVDRACRDHGFFKLVGHGLNDLIDRMWSQTELFFGAPQEFKYGLMRPADSAFGYFNREMTKLKRDQKETFDYHGLKTDAAGKSASDFWPDQQGDNLETAGLREFETVLKEFYWANTLLAEKALALVCSALGENTDALQGMFGPSHTTLARLNHYPPYDPLPADEHTQENVLGDMALHEHTDPGALTLLYQDSVGGLQTQSTQDGWIDVPPEDYSFVVNLGDLMQVWSNDRYKAAAHRVLPVPSGTSRYSMPFFYSPRYDAVIESIVSSEAPRYRPFSWYDFATARVADNYENLGKADTQVTDYRLSA